MSDTISASLSGPCCTWDYRLFLFVLFDHVQRHQMSPCVWMLSNRDRLLVSVILHYNGYGGLHTRHLHQHQRPRQLEAWSTTAAPSGC